MARRSKRKNTRGPNDRVYATRAVQVSLARDWLAENPGADELPVTFLKDLTAVGCNSRTVEQMLLKERR